MAEGGSVKREVVILVLRTVLHSNAVKVEDGRVTIFVADNPRVFQLPLDVTRRQIQELSNRYAIPVYLFYNPGQLDKGSEKPQ